MFQQGPNDALSQNFMKLGLLVAEKNVDRQTNTQTRFMFYKYRCLQFNEWLQNISIDPRLYFWWGPAWNQQYEQVKMIVKEVCEVKKNFNYEIK